MDRRRFVAGIGGALAAPLARAQAAKICRIGALGFNPRAPRSTDGGVVEKRLRELGYVEGRDLVIDWRSAEPKTGSNAGAWRQNWRAYRARRHSRDGNNLADGGCHAGNAKSIPIVMTTGLNAVQRRIGRESCATRGQCHGRGVGRRARGLRQGDSSFSRKPCQQCRAWRSFGWWRRKGYLQPRNTSRPWKRRLMQCGVATFRVAVKDEHDFERAFTHASREGANGL